MKKGAPGHGALDPAPDVTGIREGRGPAGAVPPRVPADVVGVDMRADHEIDVLGPYTLSRKARQVIRIEVVEPLEGPRPSIADARVDQDRQVALSQKPGVDVDEEVCLVRGARGGDTGVCLRGDGGVIPIGKKYRRREREGDLVDPGYRPVAELACDVGHDLFPLCPRRPRVVGAIEIFIH